jgi:hypothetical protein
MMNGYSVVYDEGESVVDAVVVAAEKYYKRTGRKATLANVPKQMTDREVESILKAGIVKEVVRKTALRFVLVGEYVRELQAL